GRGEGERFAPGIADADELGGVSTHEQQKAHGHHDRKSFHRGGVTRSHLRMRTPSPQRGEGWGEGALTARPYPLTPALSPLGRGGSYGRHRLPPYFAVDLSAFRRCSVLAS